MDIALHVPGEKKSENVLNQADDNCNPDQVWKVLVVDDEEEVHRLTRMVLEDYSFEGRNLKVYAAYTGEDAIKIMSGISDIALVMLDVVMETDDAGLKVVRFIREELKNDIVQIVLRTGQPGLAPPQEIITEYDINSYNSKIELTAQKIFTIVTASIRAFKLASSLNKANEKLQEELVKRKKDEEEIRQLSRFREIVIDNASMWFSVFDASGNAVVWNKAAEKISGYSIDEIRNLSNGERLLYPDKSYASEIRKDFYENLKKSDFISDYETTIMCKDGTSRVISWNFKNYSGDDLLSGAIMLGRDVTEHKKLESQFLQAQKMDAVGRLAGGIAHDFNNMLTVIRGHCELLFVKLGKKNPVFEKVGQIDRAAERAEILTKQLLAFSHHASTKLKPVSLSSVVDGMKDMIERLVAENIRVILRIDETPGIVKADSSQIEQIIMNLVVNARDAMPDGGDLVVEIRDFMPGDNLAGAGEQVYLIVSDTGSGMGEAVRERIFEPFFTTKEKGKGTGLGLSTVYGIVNQSRGSIRVDTNPGRGTAFVIRLPKAVSEEGQTPQPRNEVVHSLNGTETVLVVEDQAEVLEMTGELLRLYGYRVIEAQNAGSALLLYEKHGEDIDLVLTDVKMDLVDGTQLAKRLKALYPRVRIIFMSGYAEKTIEHPNLFELGLNFIQKPFSVTDLLTIIRQELDASS